MHGGLSLMDITAENSWLLSERQMNGVVITHSRGSTSGLANSGGERSPPFRPGRSEPGPSPARTPSRTDLVLSLAPPGEAVPLEGPECRRQAIGADLLPLGLSPVSLLAHASLIGQNRNAQRLAR